MTVPFQATVKSLSSPSPEDPRIEFKPTRRVWPGVQIARRRCHVGMSERGLDLSERGPTIQSVRAMGMT